MTVQVKFFFSIGICKRTRAHVNYINCEIVKHTFCSLHPKVEYIKQNIPYVIQLQLQLLIWPINIICLH